MKSGSGESIGFFTLTPSSGIQTSDGSYVYKFLVTNEARREKSAITS